MPYLGVSICTFVRRTFVLVKQVNLSALSRCVLATDMSLPDLRAARPGVCAASVFVLFYLGAS